MDKKNIKRLIALKTPFGDARWARLYIAWMWSGLLIHPVHYEWS